MRWALLLPAALGQMLNAARSVEQPQSPAEPDCTGGRQACLNIVGCGYDTQLGCAPLHEMTGECHSFITREKCLAKGCHFDSSRGCLGSGVANLVIHRQIVSFDVEPDEGDNSTASPTLLSLSNASNYTNAPTRVLCSGNACPSGWVGSAESFPYACALLCWNTDDAYKCCLLSDGADGANATTPPPTFTPSVAATATPTPLPPTAAPSASPSLPGKSALTNARQAACIAALRGWLSHADAACQYRNTPVGLARRRRSPPRIV